MPDFIIRSWTKEHFTDFNDFVVTADTVEAAAATLINAYNKVSLTDLIRYMGLLNISLLEKEGTNRSTDGESGWSFVDVDGDVIREIIIKTDSSNYNRTEGLQPRHVKINRHVGLNSDGTIAQDAHDTMEIDEAQMLDRRESMDKDRHPSEFDVLSSYVIIVHQPVADEDLSAVEDRRNNPTGTYVIEDVTSEEDALGIFHTLVPIDCLDDFNITIHPLLATLNKDLVERQNRSDNRREDMFSQNQAIGALSPEFPSIFAGPEQNLEDCEFSRTALPTKKQMDDLAELRRKAMKPETSSIPPGLQQMGEFSGPMPLNGPHPTRHPYGPFFTQQPIFGMNPNGSSSDPNVEPRTGKKWTIGKGVLELEGTKFIITHIAGSDVPFQANWNGNRIPNGGATTLGEAKAAVGQYLADLIAMGLEN